MDIWGDPWADHAKPELPNPTKKKESEQEHEVVKGYEDVKPVAGVFLDGFGDEAGWGDFEESTGEGLEAEKSWNGNDGLGWNDDQEHEEEVREEQTHLEQSTGVTTLSPDWNGIHKYDSSSEFPPGQSSEQESDDSFRSGTKSSGWNDAQPRPSNSPNSPQSSAHVHTHSPAQASDPHLTPCEESSPRPSTSSTVDTILSVDIPKTRSSPDLPPIPNNDNGDRWTRNSLSPSEASVTDDSRSPESLRTSFDYAYPDSKTHLDKEHINDSQESLDGAITNGSAESERGVLPEPIPKQDKEEPEHADGENDRRLSAAPVMPKPRSGPQFHTDLNLVKDIFHFEAGANSHKEPEEDLIDSTSTRKAWYRLSRPQTLREFNLGDSDGSYVRVSWPKSTVRLETLKIVTRWSSEDRLNGRVVLGGKPGAVAFGWDQPSDGLKIPPRRASGSRRKMSTNRREHGFDAPSSSELKSPVVFHASPAVSTPVAQFNWSTSPTQVDPPSGGPIASIGDILESPPAPKSSAAIPEQEIRSKPPPHFERSDVSIVKPPSALRRDFEVISSTAKPDLGKLDTTEVTLNASAVDDDDDEWGEMVKSPSAPPSPPLPPVPTPTNASGSVTKIDEHIPIISSRRRPTPIDAPPPAQVIPGGMLSPARKAAFNAARVTRTLSSQQTRIESPPGGSDEFANNSSELRDLPPLRLDNETGQVSLASNQELESPNLAELDSKPSPLGRHRDDVKLLSSGDPYFVPVEHPLPAPTSFLDADLSFFDAPPPQTSAIRNPPNDWTSSSPARNVQTLVQLTHEEEELAQGIVRKLPNLSFMLR